MNRYQFLFGGVLLTFALGWLGLAVAPQVQLGNLQPQIDEDVGDMYPVNAGGIAAQGRRVYAANGCVYCHTQQVREKHGGSDIDRGWGVRRTVARDYIYDSP